MTLPKETKTGIRVKKKSHFAMAGVIFIAYVAFFSFVSFLKYDSFAYKDIDFTIYLQNIINILQGRLMTTGYGDFTVFVEAAGHISLVPFMLAPVYALFSYPYTLLFCQALFLGSGIILVYLIAEHVLDSKAALGFSLLYAFYPAVQYVNLFEFHLIAFCIPFLLGMYYCYLKRKFAPFLGCMFLALSCREEVSLVVAAWGAYTFFSNLKKNRRDNLRWGLMPLIAGGVYAVAAIIINIPQLNMALINRAVHSSSGIKFTHHALLGNSLGKIFGTFAKPGYILAVLFSSAKLKYMMDLFMPLSFLPCLYIPGLLVVFFGMFQTLFSNWPLHNQVYFQHSSMLIPFLFISAIMGFARLRRIIAQPLRKFIILIVGTLAAVSILSIGPLVRLGVIIPQLEKIKASRETDIKSYLLRQIPAQVPLIVTSELSSHLEGRHPLSFFYIFVSDRHLYCLEEVKKKYRLALVDFNDPLTFQLIESGLKDNLSSSCFIFQDNWGVKETVDSLAIFEKGYISGYRLVESLGVSRQKSSCPSGENCDYAVTSFKSSNSFIGQVAVIALEAVIHKIQPGAQDYIPWVRVSNSRGQMFERPLYAPFRIYPFKYWKTNELVRIKAKVSLPKGFAAERVTASISMQLYKRKKLFDLVEKYVILNFL